MIYIPNYDYDLYRSIWFLSYFMIMIYIPLYDYGLSRRMKLSGQFLSVKE